MTATGTYMVVAEYEDFMGDFKVAVLKICSIINEKILIKIRKRR